MSAAQEVSPGQDGLDMATVEVDIDITITEPGKVIVNDITMGTLVPKAPVSLPPASSPGSRRTISEVPWPQVSFPAPTAPVGSPHDTSSAEFLAACEDMGAVVPLEAALMAQAFFARSAAAAIAAGDIMRAELKHRLLQQERARGKVLALQEHLKKAGHKKS